MLRVLSLVFVLVVAAASAQAASISVTREYFGSHPEDPGPGDMFRLTVTGTANEGEIASFVFGRLVFFGGASITNGVVQQTPLVTLDVIPWTAGPVSCSGNTCDMINQFGAFTPRTVSNTPLTIATVTFTIAAPGSLYARWETGGGFEFSFFDAPVPPDVCIISSECPIIPEPATGALLGLGLLGLALSGARARAS